MSFASYAIKQHCLINREAIVNHQAIHHKGHFLVSVEMQMYAREVS